LLTGEPDKTKQPPVPKIETGETTELLETERGEGAAATTEEAGGEGAATTTEGGEGAAATEETAPGGEGAAATATNPATKNLEKRIGKLLGALEKQQQQIEELRNSPDRNGAAPTTDAALIFDERKLADLETANQQGLDQTEDLIAQLGTDADGVAEVLRGLGADFKDASGQPDWTAARMGRELRSSRQRIKERLRQIPTQRERAKAVNGARTNFGKFLARPEVAKAAPFLADEESEQHALYQQFRRMPLMQSLAGGDYWSAAAVIGHRVLGPLLEAQARNGGGGAAATATKGGGGAAATTLPRRGALPQLGHSAPRPTGLTGLKAAKERYAKSRSDEDLAKVLEAVGM
jgi:hypothetical protein